MLDHYFAIIITLTAILFLLLIFLIIRVFFFSSVIEKLKSPLAPKKSTSSELEPKNGFQKMCINPLSKQERHFKIYKGHFQFYPKNTLSHIDYNLNECSVFSIYKMKNKRDN